MGCRFGEGVWPGRGSRAASTLYPKATRAEKRDPMVLAHRNLPDSGRVSVLAGSQQKGAVETVGGLSTQRRYPGSGCRCPMVAFLSVTTDM